MQKEKRFSYIIQNFILIAIIMVSSLMSNLMYFGEYTPFYEITIIFFSGIFYPRAISFVNLLIYGIFRDILFAHPIGYSSLLFLSFKTFVNLQEEKIENLTVWNIYFQFIWNLGVALILQAVVLFMVFKYDFFQLLYALIKKGLCTIMLYPFAHLCYNALIKLIDRKYYNVADES